MTREDFIVKVGSMVQAYINEPDIYGENAQLRVNPLSLEVGVVNGRDLLDEIADNDEAIEDAAAADRPEAEDAADYQVEQNPDFYTVESLINKNSDGHAVPDAKAIAAIADLYIH